MGMRHPKAFPANERKLRYLLYDLCVKWGYCIPPAVGERIASCKEITADQFAIEVLKAEGFAPEYEGERVRQIVELFVAQIGTDRLSAN